MDGHFTMAAILRAVVVLGGSAPSTYHLRRVLSRFSCRYTYQAVQRCVWHGYLQRAGEHGLVLTDAGRLYLEKEA